MKIIIIKNKYNSYIELINRWQFFKSKKMIQNKKERFWNIFILNKHESIINNLRIKKNWKKILVLLKKKKNYFGKI